MKEPNDQACASSVHPDFPEAPPRFEQKLWMAVTIWGSWEEAEKTLGDRKKELNIKGFVYSRK